MVSLQELQSRTVRLANLMNVSAEDDDKRRVREHVLSAAMAVDIATARLQEAIVLMRGPMRQADENEPYPIKGGDDE